MTKPKGTPVAVVEFDPTEGGKYCGAKTRPGAKYSHCHISAGKGTDHVGQGRCRLHGGATPITTGRGSRNKPRYGAEIERPKLRELYERMEELENPLDIRPDLALARANMLDALNRWNDFQEALIEWHRSFLTGAAAAKPRRVLDPSMVIGHIDTVTKIAEREWKRVAENAITKRDFVRLVSQMSLAVERRLREAVSDEAVIVTVMKQLRDDWLSLATAAA